MNHAFLNHEQQIKQESLTGLKDLHQLASLAESRADHSPSLPDQLAGDPALPPESWPRRQAIIPIPLCVGARDLNSGSHTHAASVLPTEPAPWPLRNIFK